MKIRNLIIESICEDLSENALYEANSFNELPNAWKKIATKRKSGGAKSEVEVVASRGKIKDLRLFESTLKNAVKSAKNYEITWVELNGKEILAIIHEAPEYAPRDPAYSIVLADGAMKEIEVSVKAAWSDRFQGRGADRKYIPPSYSKFKSTKMKADDAFYRSLDIFREMAVAAAFGTELNPDAIGWKDKEKALESMVVGGKVEIKGLLPDVDRARLRDQRKENRAGINTADQEDKKKVIRKLVDDRVKDIRAKIESTIPDTSKINTMIDKALAGQFDYRKDGFKAGDLSDLQNLLSELNDILAATSSASKGDYRSGKIEFSDTDWKSQNKTLKYSLKDLLKK